MRTLSVFLWLCLGMILVSSCTPSAPMRLPSQAADDDAALGPGDLFEVRVYNEKELSGNYQVGPDGTIAFPFIGVVTVAGKDTRTVSHELSERLEQGGYLRNAYVSVSVQQANSRRVSVLGAVARPGTFPVIPGMTAIQAISQAGGFTPLASKDETVVTRRMAGKLERYRIPMTDIARGGADDFVLRSGDLVFVPERVF